MKCKFCQAELEEGVTLCPACGKEQDAAEETAAVETEETVAAEVEETPAAEIKEGIKATPGKIALAIVAGIAVLALLIAMVIGGIDGDILKPTAEATVAPTEEILQTEPVPTVVEGDIPPAGNPDDVTCKGSYTVTNEELEANRDTVIATLGDVQLTIGQLQIYYWETIYAFDSSYGSYAAELGLNVLGNMDRQLCAVGDVSTTWQQYFLDYAINTWHTHQAVALAGRDAGYELEEIYQNELAGMEIQMEEMAAVYGMADTDEWIRNYVGPGCSAADYLNYLETYYRGYGYLEQVAQNMTVTADEVDAYYAENETMYTQNGITKETGKYYNVRHILLKPSENAETGEDGYPVYTEEEWTACEAEAQQLLDAWKSGDATEDSFAALAMEKSEDLGSQSNGGLYENLTAETNFVPTFKEWYMDENRQVGDTGLVKSPHGYHIMYFVDSNEIWFATAEADLISARVNAKLPEAKETYPLTVDYSAIQLGTMVTEE